jgi:hypothetical protein
VLNGVHSRIGSVRGRGGNLGLLTVWAGVAIGPAV